MSARHFGLLPHVDTCRTGPSSQILSIGTDPHTYTYVNGDPVNLIDPTGHVSTGFCYANDLSPQECEIVNVTGGANNPAQRVAARLDLARKAVVATQQRLAYERAHGGCSSGLVPTSVTPSSYGPNTECLPPDFGRSSQTGFLIFGGAVVIAVGVAVAVCILAEPCGAGAATLTAAAGVVGGAATGDLTQAEQLVSTAAEGGGIAEQLGVAESHLGSIDAMTGPNRMMLDRIAEAQQSGRALSFGEENFLLHETTEARLMGEGLSQEAAHAGALETHPLYANYDPEVIKAFPEYFNSNWRNYWGIG